MQQAARLLPPTSFASPGPSSILLARRDDAPPHKVPVLSSFARVTPTEPGDPFPSISSSDQVRVKNWIDRDLEFETKLSEARQRKRAEVIALAEEMTNGQDWLGPVNTTTTGGPPQSQFRIRWDDDKERELSAKTRGPLRKPIKLSKRQLRSAASRSEILIPIRLDIEHEAWKLRDTFTWNLLETDITPESFASHLCADLRLPERPFLKEIITTIKKAIEGAEASDQPEALTSGDGTTLRDLEESRKWFEERAYERRRQPVMSGLDAEGDVIVEETNVPNEDAAGDELRITIKLDITLDATQLVDRVEWDINNPRNSPEEFAENFTAELGLTGEFTTAIAHSIREQVDTYVKSLSLLNYASTGTVTDDELRREFLPTVHDPFRWETADLYSPALIQLSNEDVDRNEKEREREVRRKRRQTKGRGVTLPDREAVKTHRTLVPRPLPGLMQTQLNGGDVVYPMPELSHPYPLVVSKSLPPKPPGLETSDSAPLRLLVKERDAPAGPAPVLRGAALANAIAKRARLAGVERTETGRPEDFGLHPHMINGVWHCANCGVPESVAVGRRKGPTGVQNLCGACGKHYNRFRKQRICEYTTDPNFHAAAKAKETNPRGRPAASTTKEGVVRGRPRKQQNGPSRAAESSTLQIPAVKTNGDDNDEGDDDDDEEAGDSDESEQVRAPTRKKRRPNQYGSPDTPFVADDSDSGSASSDSSSDEEQAAETTVVAPPPPQTRSNPVQTQSVPPRPAAPALPRVPDSASITTRPEPLPWMIAAANDLRARQVDDRFELIPKPKPGPTTTYEWRIRCLDCPGKLYNLGPGESFEGFFVHFKNRNHRTNVENRLAAAQQ
ncbi:SWI/SNF chromatin-remodeling complex subunit SNF5 [Sporobolomyces salmoneus]|uniref:SWI/SNF chromatin-remodeling complex subunit SNF5 n=1 Tax=Sporobolomyces salmoneus TaxID=183962 RepID=UPI00316D7531